MTAPQPLMYSVQQVAGITRVSKMTVYRLIEAGDLRAYRIGRSLRVSSRDLNAFLRSASTTPTYLRPGEAP